MEEIIRRIVEGVDLQKASEDALALSGADREELLVRIGTLKDENAGKFLTLLYPRLIDKKLRKLVKKDLFRLKTLGIPVEEPKAAGESVLRKVEVFREGIGLMSNYDAALTRVVLAAVELKKNHFLFSHAIVHLQRGLEEMMSLEVNRGQLEELVRDYVARTKSPMVLASISPLYAGFVIEEASGISGKEADDAKSLNRLLATTRGDAKKPNDVYTLSTGESVEPASVDAVLKDELFEPLLLEWRGIEEDRKRLDDVINPGIVLPPAVIEERRTAFFEGLPEKESVRALLTPFRRMLEDSAYLFFCLKELNMHAGLVALLKSPEEVKKALVRFLGKTLIQMEKKEKENEQPGLIVDPYSRKRQ